MSGPRSEHRPDDYAEAQAKEARLRLHVLRAHLEVAEAGAYDHVLRELIMLGLGKDAAGKPIQVKERTRAQALGIAIRAMNEAARIGVPSINIDARKQEAHLHAELPLDPESLAAAARILAEQGGWAPHDEVDAAPALPEADRVPEPERRP